MDMVTALAVTLGVLVAVLMRAASIFTISANVSIIAWACFIASGGKVTGLIRTVAGLLSGVIWSMIANFVIGAAGLETPTGVAVVFGCAALLVVLQSKIRVLSFIPAGLCGLALSTRATNAPIAILVTTALVAGVVLGFVAEWVSGRIAKKAA